jgi:hypothetical protein
MRVSYLYSAVLVALLAGGSDFSAAQYSYAVTPGVQAINLVNGSGEVQSTVVPPGLKGQCPAGRFLISMDTVRPPHVGTVIGRDLNTPATPDIQSTFDPDPDAAHDAYGTNDDDIVTLPNGDVLLLWGYHSLAPLNPKPAWFDVTFGANTGPGVRRGTMVYRSTDCGQSFQFLTRIDPAKLGDGLCANPQPLKPPPAPPLIKYANGGSDGQLAKVSGGSSVYLTMDCVGFLQDKSKPGFVLSQNSVDRTYVLRSTDEGANWTDLGFIPGLGHGDTGWRTGIVAMQNGDLAFGAFNFFMFAHKQNNGTYSFSSATYPTTAPSGWSDTSNPVFSAINGTRIMANSLLTRVPGSKSLAIAYPASIKDANNTLADGYELFLFDPSNNNLAQAAPILPTVHALGHFLMHMVAIDPGSGPVLLYWYDIDGNAKTATMRGRFIYNDGNYSDDFAIATITEYKGPPSPTKGQTDSFTVPYKFQTGFAWYGDYHTAGGYTPSGIMPTTSQTFHYYPMWVQSDGKARYSHVSVTHTLIAKGPAPPGGSIILYPKWKPGPPPVELGIVTARGISQVGMPHQPDEAELPRLKAPGAAAK